MPNRIIKDTLRTSKNVNLLTDFQFRVWVYLITYVDDYGRGSADPELLKGLVFTRRRGVTEQQISKALADLANAGMITLYEVDGESYLYFPNWDKHQRMQTKKSKFPAPDNVTRCSTVNYGESRCSTVNYGESPPESNPNPNPESRIRIQNPESESPPIPPKGFEEFWSAYPKKQAKAAAQKAFLKLKPDSDLLAVMLSAIERQKASSQWQRDNGQYIPNPATWLNGRRWEDEETGGNDGKIGGASDTWHLDARHV